MVAKSRNRDTQTKIRKIKELPSTIKNCNDTKESKTGKLSKWADR